MHAPVFPATAIMAKLRRHEHGAMPPSLEVEISPNRCQPLGPRDPRGIGGCVQGPVARLSKKEGRSSNWQYPNDSKHCA